MTRLPCLICFVYCTKRGVRTTIHRFLQKIVNTHIPCQRDLFDVPDDVHYLNCAYISPLLKQAQHAARDGLGRDSHPWSITAVDFFDPVDRIRQLFAQLINADADDIAIVPSASYGIATAAQNVTVAGGQRIVTLEDQYPSNVYVWRELARRNDAQLYIVDRPGDGQWTSAVLGALDDSTAVAALPNNHWMDGGLLDLEEIGQRARELGAAFIVDSSQSLGAMPLDIRRVQPDFMACAGYKWMLGPYSLSYLYVSPRWHDGIPLEYNAHNMTNGMDFPRLAELTDRYAEGARRFDAGERAQFILAPAAEATLQQLLSWGVENIYDTLGAATARVQDTAAEFGLTTLPAGLRAAHFIGLRFPSERYPDGPPAALKQSLQENNVILSQRGDSLRVTPHLYNNDADFQALEDCLKQTL